jgi:hypothetical protein
VPSKSYTVVRAWRYVDPRTGAATDYEPGDPYTGATDTNPFLLDPAGPDGRGPLIAEKTTPDKAAPKPVAGKSESDTKEN